MILEALVMFTAAYIGATLGGLITTRHRRTRHHR